MYMCEQSSTVVSGHLRQQPTTHFQFQLPCWPPVDRHSSWILVTRPTDRPPRSERHIRPHNIFLPWRTVDYLGRLDLADSANIVQQSRSSFKKWALSLSYSCVCSCAPADECIERALRSITLRVACGQYLDGLD